MLHLEKFDLLDDWYVLRGGGNWASVEGEACQWRAIAKGLREGKPVRFKRCAIDREGGLYSPRNAHSDRDIVRVPEPNVLADQIDACVGGGPMPAEETP